MGNTLNNKKANGLALLPFLVFIVIYMGAGLVYQSKGVDMAFYQFPSVTAMFLAVLVAFIMFKGSINEKFDTLRQGRCQRGRSDHADHLHPGRRVRYRGCRDGRP
ncbi:MAG: hypothetical protein ACLU38_12000 [Dysosmobacter sp.]